MRYPDDVVTLTASPIEAMIKWLMEDYDPRWSQVVPVRGPFSIIAALCPEAPADVHLRLCLEPGKATSQLALWRIRGWRMVFQHGAPERLLAVGDDGRLLPHGDPPDPGPVSCLSVSGEHRRLRFYLLRPPQHYHLPPTHHRVCPPSRLPAGFHGAARRLPCPEPDCHNDMPELAVGGGPCVRGKGVRGFMSLEVWC